jgi:hypothetical protein
MACQVTIKNKFAALENLDDIGTSIGHGKLLERTKENRPNSVSGFVNQNHIKPWFNEKNKLSFSVNIQQL